MIQELKAVKQRPMGYKPEMVTSIFWGTKTKTRRELKPQPQIGNVSGSKLYAWNGSGNYYVNDAEFISMAFENVGYENCPYGQVGDILWVREQLRRAPYIGSSWYYVALLPDEFDYSEVEVAEADQQAMMEWSLRKKRNYCPSIHMPKFACRLWLEITDIKAERLHDITEEEAIAEGVQVINCFDLGSQSQVVRYRDYSKDWQDHPKAKLYRTALHSFRSLWTKINGAVSWSENPFVWVISFKVIEKPHTL
jgi:hypothetical protein